MQLTLAEGRNAWTMLAVALAAVALAGGFYYRAFGSLPLRQWRTLLVLRIVAILLVVLLLFRPVLSYQQLSADKPAILFLLDTSSSMGVADDSSGRTRFEQARDQLSKWCEKLKGDFRVKPIAFAERAGPLDGASQLAGLKPTGRGTSISAALAAAEKSFPPSEVAAVILLSDGVHNMAGRPAEIARGLGMTVHCVGVGASLRNNPSFRDIMVTGIDCPPRMMLGNLARVTGSVDAIGLGGRVIQAYLDEDGRQIGEQELTLDDAEGPQQVSFEFRPAVKGRHTYTVRVPPVAEEKIVENNQRSAVATVVERGIRVLYIEGTLRAEYGALADRFLAKDPDLEFSALVQTRPNVFLQRTNMTGVKLAAIPTDQATVDKFDVFILGDIDSSYLRPQQQEMLLKRVRSGAGLLMLGGYHSLGPGGYTETPLASALPVELGGRKLGQFTEPMLPLLTPEGVRHPIFANIGEFFPTRQSPPKQPGLPPLDGCTRVGRARPGASVLATLPTAEGSMPVLATQPLGRGRMAVFTGDTTRNWQQGPRALDRQSPFLRFWGQMVRWLAGRSEAVDTQASVVAETDKAAYALGEPIQISAVVRDKDGQGAGNVKVNARVRGPVAASAAEAAVEPPQHSNVLAPTPGPAGHYGGVFQPETSGQYEVIADAQLAGTTISSEKIVVQVGRVNLEFERLDLDETMLNAIAAATGGQHVHLSTADHLIDQLDRTQRKKTVVVEHYLYWPPGVWPLLVGLLTTEWFLRRKYHLR
ncbi:MAG: glutamine amidotransferase [Thermoguttaceae bacterium]